MIEYIKLFWEDAPEGEPSVILYEVDTENERLALRSIDISADGRTRNIPDLYDGAIEITPIPTVEELNAHIWGEEFHACVVGKRNLRPSGKADFIAERFEKRGMTMVEINRVWLNVDTDTNKITLFDRPRVSIRVDEYIWSLSKNIS